MKYSSVIQTYRIEAHWIGYGQDDGNPPPQETFTVSVVRGDEEDAADAVALAAGEIAGRGSGYPIETTYKNGSIKLWDRGGPAVWIRARPVFDEMYDDQKE